MAKKQREEWKKKLDEWKQKNVQLDKAARAAHAQAAGETEEELKKIHRYLQEIRSELLNERATPRRSLRLL